MTGQSRLDIARHDIVDFFDGQPRRVLRAEETAMLIESQRRFWRLASTTRARDVIKYLAHRRLLLPVRLAFPRNPQQLYIWREASPYEVALGVGPSEKTSLSHYTAAVLHNLTEQVPKTIYVSVEQSAKKRERPALTQGMVDEAFSKPSRETLRVAEYREWRIAVVNAVASKGLGATAITAPGLAAKELRVSDLERTLIDLAVRPSYGGDLDEVLQAFRHALPLVSINRLRAYLRKLNFLYPYHQIVGFYLEACGARADILAPLAQLPREVDIPLAHGISRDRYSSRWRVWYPSGFGELPG